jgi:hypothetical protein
MKGSPVRVRASASQKPPQTRGLCFQQGDTIGGWATYWATRRVGVAGEVDGVLHFLRRRSREGGTRLERDQELHGLQGRTQVTDRRLEYEHNGEQWEAEVGQPHRCGPPTTSWESDYLPDHDDPTAGQWVVAIVESSSGRDSPNLAPCRHQRRPAASRRPGGRRSSRCHRACG